MLLLQLVAEPEELGVAVRVAAAGAKHLPTRRGGHHRPAALLH
jgi:hypothetical protein